MAFSHFNIGLCRIGEKRRKRCCFRAGLRATDREAASCLVSTDTVLVTPVLQCSSAYELRQL